MTAAIHPKAGQFELLAASHGVGVTQQGKQSKVVYTSGVAPLTLEEEKLLLDITRGRGIKIYNLGTLLRALQRQPELSPGQQDDCRRSYNSSIQSGMIGPGGLFNQSGLIFDPRFNVGRVLEFAAAAV